MENKVYTVARVSKIVNQNFIANSVSIAMTNNLQEASTMANTLHQQDQYPMDDIFIHDGENICS